MRAYLPATSTVLRRLVDDGELRPPLTAFAVTPGLLGWYAEDDPESLEYAAMSEAARTSLRLVDLDAAARRRRVVLAVDIPDADVTVRDDRDRGVVEIARPIVLRDVASAHVDDLDAEPAVTAGASVVLEADLGDPSAQDTVDDVEGFELSWYATQELAALLQLL